MIMRKSWWRVIAVYMFLLAAAFMYWPLTIYAEAGDGSGGGGGPAVPLYMDWTYPRDGENNISVNPIIQCKFSHNVAHFEVQKRNKTLFSLRKEDGTDVPIQAFTADVQIEFDKRQYIYLYPLQPLEENTTYHVYVKEGVQAKNGMATETEQHFSFVTGSKNYTVPLLIDNENKASGEEQVVEVASGSENSNHSIQSEDVSDDEQVMTEAGAQQTDISPIPAQTDKAAQQETDTQTQEQPVQEQPVQEQQTPEQTQIPAARITSGSTWILLAVTTILSGVLSTVLRLKISSAPKLPCLTASQIRDHYGKR